MEVTNSVTGFTTEGGRIALLIYLEYLQAKFMSEYNVFVPLSLLWERFVW